MCLEKLNGEVSFFLEWDIVIVGHKILFLLWINIMNLKELSIFFDIETPAEQTETAENSDYTEPAKKANEVAIEPFEQKVQDLHAILSESGLVENMDENKVIEEAMLAAKASVEQKEVENMPEKNTEKVIPETDDLFETIFDDPDLEAQVEADIKKAAEEQKKKKKIEQDIPFDGPYVDFPADVQVNKTDPSIIVTEIDAVKMNKNTVSVNSGTVVEINKEDMLQDNNVVYNEVSQAETPKQIPVDKNNPLNLNPHELKLYKDIQTKYPQFVLYNGNPAYRPFYKNKFDVLCGLMVRFPILETSDIRSEMHKCNIDHYVGTDEVSFDLLRRRVDTCLQHRTRINSLLTSVYEQFFIWERCLEMLRGKLCKDYYLKNAQQRDGLVLEHLTDMEMYVHDVKGVMEALRHIDGILKTSSDSLSRQIACLQYREATGFYDKHPMEKHGCVGNHGCIGSMHSNLLKDPALDGLDALEEGLTIEMPKSEAVNAIDYGGERDELSDIGL